MSAPKPAKAIIYWGRADSAAAAGYDDHFHVGLMNGLSSRPDELEPLPQSWPGFRIYFWAGLGITPLDLQPSPWEGRLSGLRKNPLRDAPVDRQGQEGCQIAGWAVRQRTVRPDRDGLEGLARRRSRLRGAAPRRPHIHIYQGRRGRRATSGSTSLPVRAFCLELLTGCAFPQFLWTTLPCITRNLDAMRLSLGCLQKRQQLG